MRKACIVASSYYKGNRIFDMNDKESNRNNCLYPFYVLKNEFKKHDIDLSTHDINTIEESEIVIYNEMPEMLPKKEDIHKSYLLIYETELILPNNWNLKKHEYFSKIFTWHDQYVDNQKYFKINYAHEIPKDYKIENRNRQKLCTLISGNKKKKSHLKELYSERLRAIEWFEEHQSADFQFYGIGWDAYMFSRPYHYFNRIGFLRRLFTKKYKTYCGMVESKFETMSEYKFAICYENVRDIPGYISEKIMDCFFAGCVPIYLGAPNILDFIPQECFIDKDKFNSYEELYDYIKNMSAEDYNEYLDQIEAYINCKEFEIFSVETFAKSICKVVLG